jgi:hypothetical protein
VQNIEIFERMMPCRRAAQFFLQRGWDFTTKPDKGKQKHKCRESEDKA